MGTKMKEWMIKAIYQHLKEHGHIKQMPRGQVSGI